MNYRKNEDKLCNDYSRNRYNSIEVTELDTADSPATYSAVTSTKRTFETVPGQSSITEVVLIGGDVELVALEGSVYSKVDIDPSDLEYTFDSVTGTIQFDPDSLFAAGAKVFVMWVSVNNIYSSDEPVTLQEMKNYLRLIGFEDEGESPVTALSDFSLDDELLQQEITAARQRLEEYTGLSFVPKTLRAIIYSGAGNIRLEQGPVRSITSFVDADGNVIESYTMIGTDIIEDSFDSYRTMIYEAGYIVLPKKFKIAIMMWVAASYEHRGDEKLTEDIYKQAKRQAGTPAVAFF